jgi:hypothetical protein
VARITFIHSHNKQSEAMRRLGTGRHPHRVIVVSGRLGIAEMLPFYFSISGLGMLPYFVTGRG